MAASRVPDITLVSGCFCMNRYNNGARDLAEILNLAEPLAALPAYIVYFGDADTIPLLRKKREEHGLLGMTEFREIAHDQMWSFRFVDKCRDNREKYWPTRDARTCVETNLCTYNKFDFVLQIMAQNPFATAKFGWIDAFIGENGRKICEDYSPDKMLRLLHGLTDKFHLQILNVVDKKFAAPEHKREYYEQYRWLVCGCLFTCGRAIGEKILPRLKEICAQTTEQGYGHGEEMFYLEVLDEFYDDIHRAYGDYGQIVNNFLAPTRNAHYIAYILARYIDHGYFREAGDCADALLAEIESYRLAADPEMHMTVMFQKFVAVFYHNRAASLAAIQHIRDVCAANPRIQRAFDAKREFYETQFAYCA